MGACAITLVNTQALAFGLTWTASQVSGTFASVVLVLMMLPRVIIAPLGGRTADRHGIDKVLKITSALFAGSLIGLYIASTHLQPVSILIAAALLIGILDGYYRPTIAAYPATIVHKEQLPRSLAARQTVNQTAQFIGPGVGGLIITWGIGGNFLAAASGHIILLATMMVINRSTRRKQANETRISSISSSFKTIGQSKVLFRLTLLTSAVAAFILPIATIIIPLRSREQGWTATTAGILTGSFGLGFVVVALLVTIKPSLRTTIKTSTAIYLAAAGATVVAITNEAILHFVGMIAIGIGVGAFGTSNAPVVIDNTPRESLSGVQAVLVVAQTLPYLTMALVLGYIADHYGTSLALLVCAIGTGLAAKATSCRRA